MARCCFALAASVPVLLGAVVKLIMVKLPQEVWLLKRASPAFWADSMLEPPADMQPLPPPRGMLLLPLPGGGSMPASGLGMCCRVSAVGGDARRSVLWYLLLGGRHLDTAEIYGNHKEIGAAIREAAARGIPRAEVFLTTKIPSEVYGVQGTERWVSKALSDLDVDYIDLVLLHSPNTGTSRSCGEPTPKRCRQVTWDALAKFRDRGIIRNLGVSNFGPRQMQELLELGSAPIAANQLEFHPLIPEVYRQTVNWCHEHGIAVTAYCSLGGVEGAPRVVTMKALREAGGRLGKSPGQVLLRWAIEKNISVIPGTGNLDHMRENLALFDFSLDEEAARQLDGMPPLKAVRSSLTFEPDQVE